MKTINETFTEKEFILLVQQKNGSNWHDFILKLLKGGYKNGNNISKKLRD